MKKNALFKIRKKLHLTQKDVAERVNATPGQIYFLESGERKLSPEWLDRLSKALNCSKAELLGEEPAEPLTDQERALLDMFRSLPPEKKKDISLILSALSESKKES